MGEIIRGILVYLPRYLNEFGSVFLGPKQFIGEKNVNTDESFADALLFMALSLGLTAVMTAPLLPPEKEFWQYMIGQGVLGLMHVALFALALRISWRIVGGKAPVRSFFVTYAYYSGVIIVLFGFVILLAEGVFKVFDPELYGKVLEAQANSTLPPEHDSNVPFISTAILVVGYLFLSTWGLIGWGAYRQLNELSKGRSFVALLILGPFGWAIFFAILFVANAMG